MYPRQGIPFEAYRDVILTRDLIEGGLRVGDVGTVVEPHGRGRRTRGEYSVEFFDMDRQYSE